MFRFFLPFLLLVTPAVAQPSLEYESEPGLLLPEFGVLTPASQDHLDYDGDGVYDLALLKDGEGGAGAMSVVKVGTGATLGEISPDVMNQFGNPDNVMHVGFFDIKGDGTKQAVLFNSDQKVAGLVEMSEGGSDPADEEAFLFSASSLGIMDVDGDGRPEMLSNNPDTKTLQVWGDGETGTATHDVIARTLALLAPSYPNPFTDATTIAYTIDQAGPVTLDVFDLLGRRVRTLVDDALPAGIYQAVWDGRDDSGRPVASGVFLYRLRLGEAVVHRQTVRIQ